MSLAYIKIERCDTVKDINGVEVLVGDVAKLTYVGDKGPNAGKNKGKYCTITEIADDYVKYDHVVNGKLVHLSSIISSDVFTIEVLRTF
jgi:hypothetical protein